MKQNPFMNGMEKRRETKPFGRKKNKKKIKKKEKKKEKKKGKRKKTSSGVKVNC